MSDSTSHPANLAVPASAKPEPSSFYRWAVLAIISLAMFGNYYVYDCIAPIADVLSKQLGFSDSNIGLLQAIYSIPNVVMVLLGHWQLNATLQLASGTPFTARVLGAVHDVASGVNGTLRADYSGGPIEVADPTTQAFFNKGVFSVPPPGTFGTAARNTDNNGVVITNPETCARGPYTDFCSYFYAGKSVKII